MIFYSVNCFINFNFSRDTLTHIKKLKLKRKIEIDRELRTESEIKNSKNLLKLKR